MWVTDWDSTSEARMSRINIGTGPGILGLRSSMVAVDNLTEPLVVDPLLHEAAVAIALARHLRPAREQADRGQEEAIPEVGRVVTVFLEGGMGDLLVVGVVLELAGRDRDRGLVSLAVRAGCQIRVGQGGGAGHVERQNGLVQLLQPRLRCPAR